MKNAALLLSAIAITGCVSVYSLKPNAELDTSFYRLDAQNRMLCQGETKRCQDLTLIATAEHYFEPIEIALGGELTGPNYVRSLMRLMLQPTVNSYPISRIESKQYQYKLPINDQTQLVWNTLKQIRSEQFGTSNRE